MKPCHYCGRENADEALHCAECGTLFHADEASNQQSESGPAVLRQEQPLSGASATVIGILYLLAQLGVSFIVGVIGASFAAGQRNAPEFEEELTLRVTAIAALCGVIAGGAVMVWASRVAVPSALKDPSPTGAAWIVGSFKSILGGLFLGIALGVSWIALIVFIQPSSDESLSTMDRMSVSPGLPQTIWLIFALLLAPPIEELLFRGILYGGYRKSCGPFFALVITTCVFVLLHIEQIAYQPVGAFIVTGLALTALWIRLRSSAIGPAVAVHFGYNAIIAALAILYTRPQ